LDTNITMEPVKSSKLLALGYEPELFILRAVFNPSKSEYDYFDVPPEKWDSIKAEAAAGRSIGTWFGVNIAGKRGAPPPFDYAKTGSEKALNLWAKARGDEQPTSLFPPTNDVAKVEPAQAITGTVVPEIPEVELPKDQDGLLKRAAQVEIAAKSLFIMKGNVPTLVIFTAEGYAQAVAQVVAKLAEKKRALAEVAKIKEPATAAWKAACEFEKRVIASYDAAINPLDQAAKGWKRNQEQAEAASRQAAQQREQERLDAIAAENKRVAEEQAKADAANMRAAGQEELAKEIEAQPIHVVREIAQVSVAPTEVPKVAGARELKTWKNRVDNPELVAQFYKKDIAMACHNAGIGIPANEKLAAFVNELATIFSEFHSVDEVKVGARLRPMKDAGVNFIPGVTVWSEEKTSSTGR
jgi:hypothetical protein